MNPQVALASALLGAPLLLCGCSKSDDDIPLNAGMKGPATPVILGKATADQASSLGERFAQAIQAGDRDAAAGLISRAGLLELILEGTGASDEARNALLGANWTQASMVRALIHVTRWEDNPRAVVLGVTETEEETWVVLRTQTRRGEYDQLRLRVSLTSDGPSIVDFGCLDYAGSISEAFGPQVRSMFAQMYGAKNREELEKRVQRIEGMVRLAEASSGQDHATFTRAVNAGDWDRAEQRMIWVRRARDASYGGPGRSGALRRLIELTDDPVMKARLEWALAEVDADLKAATDARARYRELAYPDPTGLP